MKCLKMVANKYGWSRVTRGNCLSVHLSVYLIRELVPLSLGTKPYYSITQVPLHMATIPI